MASVEVARFTICDLPIVTAAAAQIGPKFAPS